MRVKKKEFVAVVIGIIFCYLVQFPIFSASSTIRGRVIDEETGKGIEGVAVRVASENGVRNTLTDKEGNFNFYEIEPGMLNISFMPSSPYAMPLVNEPGEEYLLEKGKNLYISKKLLRSGVIKGRVFEKNTGELLTIDHIGLLYHFPTTTSINNNGEYVIDQIKPGKYVLILSVKDFAVRELKDIEVKKNESVQFDFSFDKYSKTLVKGQIACKEDNTPCKNTFVTIHNSNDLYTYTYTDDYGNYTFKDLNPGDYRISVSGINEKTPKRDIITFDREVKVVENRSSVVNLKIDCFLNFLDFKKT